MNEYRFYSTCVAWPRRKMPDLIDMLNRSQDITRKTFIKHVSHDDMCLLAVLLGYSRHHKQGLTLKQDWHVSYHRSMLNGNRVYYFKRSGIEYVFTQPKEN